jgi:hypothetical protein
MTTTYKIIRFQFTGGVTIIKRGLTLDEAQAHCRREDTHGGTGTSSWFDGYDVDVRGDDHDDFDATTDPES